MTEGTPTAEIARPRRQIIERPRLTRLLDASTARIITLVAPAGYGKTTLARQWVASLGQREAVSYTVSAADCDLAAYISGISRALEPIAPDARMVIDRVSASGDVEAEIPLFAEMLADLIASASIASLVIDDYDLVAGAESAESFTLALVECTQVTVVISSRVRPNWATPKMILYGEITELGRNLLAFTTDETHELMPSQPSPSVAAGLVSLSEGWPAVIGLASRLNDPRVADVDAPPQLHDFFAAELFGKLSTAAQRAIQIVAVGGITSIDLAQELIEEGDAAVLLEEAHQAGFMTWLAGSKFELQPLMRDLMLQKTDPREDGALIERVVSFLLAREHWDQAGGTIVRFCVLKALPDLIRRSVTELLSHGRLGTLEAWLEFARQHDVTAPELDLAQSEVAFRKGAFFESRTCALAAAGAFEVRSRDDVARALVAAGRAAHALSDGPAALVLYERAAEMAETSHIKRAAEWGAVACAVDLDRDDVSQRLASLRDQESDEPIEVMTYTGRLLNLEARSGRLESLDQGRTANALSVRVDDPMARTSFRNVYAYVLSLSAAYDEAETVINAQDEDCTRHRLTFAYPHVMAARAMVAIGRRQYEAADALLQTALAIADATHDPYAVMNAHAVRSRLEICRRRFDAALAYPAVEDTRVVKSMHAELLAWHALATACLGDSSRMHRLVETARAASSSVEVQVATSCALAINALRTSDGDASALVGAAVRTTLLTGNYDGLICALRGAPDLLTAVHGDEALGDSITKVATHARDAALFPPSRDDRTLLSRREREVLALIVQGLTNQQIAQRLFISVATAKVHVHHIFQKLSVTSRSAAAVRGVAMLGIYAAPDASDSGSSEI